MRIRRSAECGNSPKNQFAQEVAIHWLSRQAEAFSNVLTAHPAIKAPGYDRAPTAALAMARLPKFDRVDIEGVATHGRAGAVWGQAFIGARHSQFCVTMRFATASARRVNETTLFVADPALLA